MRRPPYRSRRSRATLLATASPARNLDVLVSGATLPPNPGELIESHAMQALLDQAKAMYDLIVVDTPPLTASGRGSYAYTLLV